MENQNQQPANSLQSLQFLFNLLQQKNVQFAFAEWSAINQAMSTIQKDLQLVASQETAVKFPASTEDTEEASA
jgi:hypothetical protein